MTFRWFGLGALVFLVVHVLIQKVYARFAGSIGKTDRLFVHSSSSKHVVDNTPGIGGGAQNKDKDNDNKNSMDGGGLREGESFGAASRVLLSDGEEAGFKDVPLL